MVTNIMVLNPLYNYGIQLPILWSQIPRMIMVLVVLEAPCIRI